MAETEIRYGECLPNSCNISATGSSSFGVDKEESLELKKRFTDLPFKPRGIALTRSLLLKTARYVIFAAFSILCLRLIAAVLLQTAPVKRALLAVLLVLTSFGSTWNPRLILFGFVAAVPLVSGIQAIGLYRGFPLTGLAFAAIFVGWFFKESVGGGKKLETGSMIFNLADILAAMVMLSLVSVLIRYPFDFVLFRLLYYPFGHQDQALYGVEAAQLLLQGIFFFRISLMECEHLDFLTVIKHLFYFHTSIIFIFATIQIMLGIPQLHWKTFGVKSPFSDIHCFGAYTSIMLFFFLALFLDSKPSKRILLAFICIYLSVLIFMSGGNITLIAVIASALVFIALKKVKFFILGALTIAAATTFLLVSPSIFKDPSSVVLKRYSKFFNVEDPKTRYGSIEARLALWDRALAMIKDFPVTGIGIGTYYADSVKYHDSTVKEWERYKSFYENAHNYYLQFAAELGLPALGIFFAIIFACYARLNNSIRRSEDSALLLIGLGLGAGVYLVTMITSHHLLVDAQQFLFWNVMAGIFVAGRRRLETDH